MKKRLVAALAAASLAVVAGPAAAQEGDAMVTVVHGVPGLTVDIYANGDALLEGFEYGTVTDPVSLPAGDYDLEIYPADADPESSDPALSATVPVPSGANASVAAHLDADGAPTLSTFVNDVSDIPAGEARVAVRHAAAAPPVEVTANDSVTIASGLANGSEAVATVPADTYSVDVALGDGTEVFTDVQLPAEEGMLTTVYAVGNGDAGYELLTNAFSGMHTTPSGVPAGSAGLVDNGLPMWVAAMMALGTLLVAGAAVPAVQRARRR